MFANYIGRNVGQGVNECGLSMSLDPVASALLYNNKLVAIHRLSAFQREKTKLDDPFHSYGTVVVWGCRVLSLITISCSLVYLCDTEDKH